MELTVVFPVPFSFSFDAGGTLPFMSAVAKVSVFAKRSKKLSFTFNEERYEIVSDIRKYVRCHARL
jgi:hypothetical protein